MRPIAMLLAAGLLAGCSLFVPPAPSSVPLPGPGETPHVDVYYRSETMCFLPIQIGDAYWTFEAAGQNRPPPLPKDDGKTPYPIPGVIRLTSPAAAIFRADSNGQELPMVRAGAENPMPGSRCL